MNFNQTALELARMRQEELIVEAAKARQLVGRRVIAVGERIAAEPRFELARSR
jgi:hypothetical protein